MEWKDNLSTVEERIQICEFYISLLRKDIKNKCAHDVMDITLEHLEKTFENLKKDIDNQDSK